MYGPCKNCGRQGLANTNNGQTGPIIFRVLQLLSRVHTRILPPGKTPQQSHQERHAMDMAKRATDSI